MTRDIEDLKHHRETAQQILSTLNESLLQERTSELLHQCPQYKDTPLAFGEWECSESPIETCVYDEEKDPAHDICLFCGDPEERK
jgi:hypothetical protein